MPTSEPADNDHQSVDENEGGYEVAGDAKTRKVISWYISAKTFLWRGSDGCKISL